MSRMTRIGDSYEIPLSHTFVLATTVKLTERWTPQ